jgi:hypothetical protein
MSISFSEYTQERSLLKKERNDIEIALKRLKKLDAIDDEMEVCIRDSTSIQTFACIYSCSIYTYD